MVTNNSIALGIGSMSRRVINDPSFSKNMLDVYFMSGYTNEEFPTELLGYNGTKLPLHNFAKNKTSGFNTNTLTFPELFPTIKTISPYKVSMLDNKGYIGKVEGVDPGDTHHFPALSITIKGMKSGEKFTAGRGVVWGLEEYLVAEKDGTYHIPEMIFPYDPEYPYCSVTWSSDMSTSNIEITINPVYTGELVFDGVDDYCIGNSSKVAETIIVRGFHNFSDKVVFDNRNKFDGLVLYTSYSSIAYYGLNDQSETYLDGELNTTIPGNMLLGKLNTAAVLNKGKSGLNEFFVGCSNGSSNFQGMNMNYIAMYDKALSQVEIKKEIVKLEKEWKRRLADGADTEIPKPIKESMVCWYSPKKQGLTNEYLKLPNPELEDFSGNKRTATLHNFSAATSSGINNNQLVFDGIKDYVYCSNMPVNITDYTIIANREYYNNPKPSVFASKAVELNTGEFMFEIVDSSIKTTMSYGISTEVDIPTIGMSYQTSKSYNSTPIARGISSPYTKELLIGRDKLSNDRCWRGALSAFLLFNRALNSYEINWVKDNLLGYVPPTPMNKSLVDAWFMSGLKNESAPTVIKGYNGSDLVTNDFWWDETSGFDGKGALVFNGDDSYLTFNNNTKIIKTLLIKFKPLSNYGIAYDQRVGILPPSLFSLSLNANQIAWNALNTDGKTYINGILNTASLGDKYLNIKHVAALTNDAVTRTPNIIYIGRGNINGSYSKIELDWIALYDKVLSEQEIKSESDKLDHEWNKNKN